MNFNFPPQQEQDNGKMASTTPIGSGPRPMYRGWKKEEGGSARPHYRQRNPLNDYYKKIDEERAREAEQQKKKEQEMMRRATSLDARNYPTLGNNTTALHKEAPDGFAEKAKEWATKQEEERLRELVQKQRADHEKNMNACVFIWRGGSRFREQERRYEEEEEDLCEKPSNALRDEWTTIERKTKRVLRERTADEMDMDAYGEEDENGEFNCDLFENNKHDHY